MATQDTRFGSVTSPLGRNVLLFSRMKGYEEMGRLFEYEIDLLSEEKQIDATKILGQAMTLAVELPAGGIRYYSGFVTQFRHHGTQGEFYLYRAVLRPWLWFLTRTANCRIFQDMSVPDIIKKVFDLNHFSDLKVELNGSYKPRGYCVQYRESDFNFVSRLIEDEGIHYFFKHEQDKHTLIIADALSAYQTIADYAEIPYFPPENTGRRSRDHIFEWHNHHEVQPGSYVLNDFDFEKPKSNLLATFTGNNSHAHANGEFYDYPGDYTESAAGESYANIRLDELQTNYRIIHGKGNARGLTAGMLFTLKDHYSAQENAKHVVVSTDFLIESNQYRSDGAPAELLYDCGFTAIRSEQQFRPRRITPVPFVQGPQTAIVVGKAGEEIWTDKYGRVKVQFHWDREGGNDENSSCWVRVSFPTAGKNWGWISLPRIGQEVIVSFLEGNPDKPIITGRVYNADQMPPYELPANQTQSGIKTRSSKEGSAENFNEIRFEDKKDAEEVYVHAEKNFNCVIENNETRKIGLSKKDKGDQIIEIQNDRTVTLNEGNDTLTVKLGKRETNVDTGDNLLNVKQGNRVTTIDQGNDTKSVKMGDHSVKVDVGKSTIEAMTSIELKVGGNSIKIDQSGITIKGIMVTVQGDAKLDAKSPMTTVNGDGMLTLKGGITMIN
ncbi:type VI secretion system Vgr family protein [Methylobacter sp.]|uniref:type VI secretion system Vgr family protein n=1 Tax=Methylobacter sp. TaxID=2051955 RepID=UPI003DA511BF